MKKTKNTELSDGFYMFSGYHKEFAIHNGETPEGKGTNHDPDVLVRLYSKVWHE